MTNSLVLVADGESKNLQILKENLEASGFVVIPVSNGNKAWEEIQQTPPNLVLTEINLPGLNGYQLLERLQADPNTKSIPLVFLTNQREIQHRVRGFEMGAKDYLVKPLHVKEVIAHIRMVLRRLERRKTEQLETYMKFSGRLDQLNLVDLVESFGVERKTGVLTLSNGRKTGQVYFRDGTVVNASLGNVRQEPAIYQMLSWDRGFFNMVFKDIDVPDEITISNLGLLLHGIKRIELREKLMGQLSSPQTSFTITPTFKMLITKKRVNGEIVNFVKLFDGKRDVEQIIDDSGLDDLIALKRIVRLYQQGFIKPTIPPEKKPVLPRKIDKEYEKIESIGSSTRSKETPSVKEPSEEKIIDEYDFDSKPGEMDKDLEKEIKPIFERIEKEKKKVVIPDEIETTEGLYTETEPEKQKYAEKIRDVESELTAEIELEDDEIIFTKEQSFVDEELIRQPTTIPKEESKIDHEEEIDRINFEAELQGFDPDAIEKEPTLTEEKIAAISQTGKQIPFEQPGPEKKATAASESEPPKNSIVVVSVDDDCKDELMDILTNDNFSSKHIHELDDLRLDFGKIKLEGFTQFNIVAISVDKPFNIFLESIKQKIRGFLFAVDCTRRETWEYTSYLIHSILYKFKVPNIVAVINFHEQNSITMDVIRYQLNLDETIPLIAWDAVDKSVIRKLMTTVTNFNLFERTRKPEDMSQAFVEKVMM